MRAGPLSDDKVIALLNAYFVPVYLSNEDYVGETATASPPEKAEKQRIFTEFVDGKLGSGDVHVYILKPDGHALEGLDIGSAVNTKNLIALLERSAARLETKAGAPVVAPQATSAAPKHDANDLVLHLVSRGEHTGTAHYSWREFPAENWIVLRPAQWRKLLPEKPVAGTTWEPDPKVMAEPLHRFYPQTEDTTDDARTNIDRQIVRATVVSVESGIVTARLEGKLTMRRTATSGKADPNVIESGLIGSIQWDAQGKDGPTIRSLQLVTEKAMHGKEPFDVAVKSVK
jgi:hypothetical protein